MPNKQEIPPQQIINMLYAEIGQIHMQVKDLIGQVQTLQNDNKKLKEQFEKTPEKDIWKGLYRER